jgi:hypothetical protein
MDKELFIQTRKADMDIVKDAAKEAAEEFEKNAGYAVEIEVDTESELPAERYFDACDMS